LSHQSTSLKYDDSQGGIALCALEPQRRDYLEKPGNLELKAYADASCRGRPFQSINENSAGEQMETNGEIVVIMETKNDV